MKKRILFALIMPLAILFSCEPEPVRVQDITLDATSITLVKGEVYKLTANLSPSNSDNKVVIWTTDNASVARVSDGGVTAVEIGETAIHAKSDDGGITATCSVTVVSERIDVTGIALTLEDGTSAPESVVLQKDESLKLIAFVVPADATNQAFRWNCSDTTVVKLSDAGVITAYAPGVANVMAISEEGGFTASCSIKVERHVGGLTFDVTELTLHERQSAIITPTITPEDAEDKSLKWESSNPDAASVVSGVVTALRAVPDPVIITASTSDGNYSASCQVTIICDVLGVRIKDVKNLELKPGNVYDLKHEVYPERATNKAVSWESDNPEVVTVSEAGTLRAIKKGAAVVKVTTQEGSFSDFCNVVVKNDISGISINPAILELKEDESSQLSVVFEASSEVSDEKISWSSSDEKVVTVDESGLATAKNAGEAVICAITEAGLHADCTVLVTKLVNSMRLEPAAMVLPKARFMAGEPVDNVFTPVIDPEGANVQLIWTSNDENVATVDSKGAVTPVGPGTTLIIATVPSSDQAKVVTAQGSVTVIQEATEITVTPSSIEMWEGDTRAVDITISPADARQDYSVSFDEASTAEIEFDKVNKTVKANTPGSAIMYLKPSLGYPQGLKASCNISVLAHVHELKSKATEEIRLPVGETISLKDLVEFVPSNSADKDLTWSSGNEARATVDANGTVTGLQSGTVVITATAKDAYKNAKVNFTVIVCETQVKSITLEPIEQLYEGETIKVNRVIDPADVLDPSLTWESSDNFVATVDQDGNVTGVKPGTAIITATSVATPGVSGKCGVTVVAKAVHVTSVTLNESNVYVFVGEHQTILAQILPENAADKSLVWTVSPSGIAGINPNGNSCSISGIAEGKATVTATSVDGGYSASCTVHVSVPVVPATTISLNKTEITLQYGASETLVATVGPSEASDKTVTWVSDDPDVADVTDGVVVAKNQEKTTTIRAISNYSSDLVATCTVHVVPQLIPVSGVSLKTENGESTLTMSVGQVARVIATITPYNATNKTIIWSVQQGGVIFVDSEGYITANKAGLSRVFAETADGGYQASMQVTVKDNPVASIVVKYKGEDVNEIVLKASSYIELTGEAVGVDDSLPPTDGSLYWQSNSTSIVTVANGRVTGVAAGTTKIVVKSISNPNVEKEIPVHVLDAGSGGNEGVEFDDWNF